MNVLSVIYRTFCIADIVPTSLVTIGALEESIHTLALIRPRETTSAIVATATAATMSPRQRGLILKVIPTFVSLVAFISTFEESINTSREFASIASAAAAAAGTGGEITSPGCWGRTSIVGTRRIAATGALLSFLDWTLRTLHVANICRVALYIANIDIVGISSTICSKFFISIWKRSY